MWFTTIGTYFELRDKERHNITVISEVPIVIGESASEICAEDEEEAQRG